MKPRRLQHAHRRALAVVLAVAAASAACGLRTPVRPPEDTAPVVPGVVTATCEADVAIVRWKRAERSADGHRLDDLAAFVVERRTADGGVWERVATIDVVDQDKIRRRKDFSWRDPAPVASSSYRVFAVNADGQEGPPTDPVVAGDEVDATVAKPAPATPAR